MSVGAAPRFSGIETSSTEGSPVKSITDSIRCDASIKRTGNKRECEACRKCGNLNWILSDVERFIAVYRPMKNSSCNFP
jgi:hypothetical protein